MGWNFRRSKKILPGVRLNFGKKSWGISFGGKHSRISFNSKTGVTARTSIPGTGISYTSKLSSGKKKQAPKGTPPRNNHIGLWILSVLFAIAGLGSLSKSVICGLLYILAAVIMIPIPTVQDKLPAHNIRGWVKVVTVIALIVVGTALFPIDSDEMTKTPSETPEVIEVQESADTQDNAETLSEAVTKPEPRNDAITLVAGEQGLYGEWLMMNEEAFYVYRVPTGIYRVTNAGKYPTQVNVYEGVVKNAETGFQEYSAAGDVAWMDVGDSGEITVPEGWFIEIHEPCKVTLIRTDDAFGAVSEPEAERVPQSPENVIEALNAEYSDLPGIYRYNASYEEGAFIIRFAAPGLGQTVEKMANGEGYISEDAMDAYEAWTVLATRLSEMAHNLVKESGRNEDMEVFILHELNHEDVIFCAINGAVCYDPGRGITW